MNDGGAPYVYGLTDKGAKEFGGKSFDDHAFRTIDHELEITDFHILLQAQCEEVGFRLCWRQDHLKTKGSIHPDAQFSLTGPTGSVNNFFVEIERQRLGRKKDGKPSIITKLERYFDGYDTDAFEACWGFRKFRIITIAETLIRARHILEAMQPELNHRMFWIGVTGAILFETPKGDTFSFSDLQDLNCPIKDTQHPQPTGPLVFVLRWPKLDPYP